MDSVVTARVKTYLTTRLHRDAYECGTILRVMRSLAQVGGFDVDGRFARAGLAAGPDARIAAGIVNRAVCGSSGSATSEYAMKTVLDRWVERNTPTGM